MMPRLHLLALCCMLVLSACGERPETADEPPATPGADEPASSPAAATTAAPSPDAALAPPAGFTTARPVVRITTDHGVIDAELFADQAPLTVATFVRLAEAAAVSERAGERTDHHFYDGLTFHRVIPDFMIQGGCPLGTGGGGPGFTFHDEIDAGSLGLDEEPLMIDGHLNPQCAYMEPQLRDQVIRPRLAAAGITAESPPADREAAFARILGDLAAMSLADFYRELGYRYRDEALPDSTPPLRGVLAMANSGPNTNGSQFFINLVDTPHLTGKHTVFGRVIAGMPVVDRIATMPTDARNRPRQPVVIESIRLLEPASVEDLLIAGEAPAHPDIGR